ncbi:MAG: hypothetical protein FJX47_00725 [Alphaproteobacteria bacterium]|nr:hypothetical protein [Alphaproteobacteria bacterium]
MLAFLALGLGGCGFRPLYGDASGEAVIAALQDIDIPQISDRVGWRIRNYLVDRVTPTGSATRARYELAIAVAPRTEGLAVQRDATVTRYNLWVSAEFKLLDRRANRVPVMVGTSHSVAAYNSLTADYATVIAQRDAEDRAARDIANDIALRLGLFFSRQQGG